MNRMFAIAWIGCLIPLAGCSASSNDGTETWDGNLPGADHPVADAGASDAATFSDGSASDAAAPPDLQTVPNGWHPVPGTSWQIQLSGAPVDTSFDVQVYDLDLFDNAASVISTLKAKGKKVICYFSAGSYEDWRPDASKFPKAVQGSPLDGWPGEWWLDVRAQAVRDLMAARMDLAVQKGCDGVDPDNVDGYTNKPGFPLTASDQIDYNRFLADAAHARGLAVGLKNDIDQIPDLVASFDWAINEECFDYDECGTLAPFIAAHKPVFQLTYGTQTQANTTCPKANALDFDALVKNLALDAPRIACR
jgi:hypothetical protein